MKSLSASVYDAAYDCVFNHTYIPICDCVRKNISGHLWAPIVKALNNPVLDPVNISAYGFIYTHIKTK